MPQRITRHLARLTPDCDASFHIPLCISIEPGSKLLTLWQLGRRRRYKIKFADVFRLAVKLSCESLDPRKPSGRRRRS